jgi:hypothetical protein
MVVAPRQRPYTTAELLHVHRALTGLRGLWIPIGPAEQASPQAVGPVFQVRVRYSDVHPQSPAEQAYWELLQRVPVLGGVGILSAVSNLLSSRSVQERDVHRILEERFATPALRETVKRLVNEERAFSVLFSHLSAVLAMAHLMAFGGNRTEETSEETDQTRHLIGDLFLFANEFFDHDPVITDAATDAELLLVTVPTWDLLNRRDLAYTMTRVYSILDEAVTSDSPEITRLRHAAFGAAPPTVNGVPVPDFIAVIFGLFAWGQKEIQQTPRLVFDRREWLRRTPAAQPALDGVLAARAKRLEEFTAALRGDAPVYDRFLAEVRDRHFLARGLNLFRSFPLLRLDENQVAILDLHFLSELLSQGVYWTLFDELPQNARLRFKDLWGRAFERYVCALLAHHYPSAAGLLRTGVVYDRGQVDALIDFGAAAMVLEIKSSLLTEPAKRSGSLEMLLADVELKFVRTADGEPKGVAQLANACRALRDGRLMTSAARPWVYPVLITDEICAEAPGFNSYLHRRFTEELADRQGIKPLTVMSVGELEEALPYFAVATPTWQALLQARFTPEDGVKLSSVHQTLYDLLGQQRTPARRNQCVLRWFEEIYNQILRLFRFPAEGRE